MGSNDVKTSEIIGNLSRRRSRGPGWLRLTDSFAILGPVLQRPRQFFSDIRKGIRLPEKIWALSISSTVFLIIYGATLGSGHSLLSLNLAVSAPFLFLISLAVCIPVMYLLDVLTGSQRSLAQVIAVLLTSLGAAATVLFSFTPIMLVFSLTGTLLHFFWLNVGILALAMLVGLIYVAQGIIRTAIVDASHNLSKINRWLHLLWMPLFLIVVAQLAWKLLISYQETGGPLMWLIWQLLR